MGNDWRDCFKKSTYLLVLALYTGNRIRKGALLIALIGSVIIMFVLRAPSTISLASDVR
jgi:hypothetical protein